VADVWAGAGLRLPPETQFIGMEDPWRYRIRGEFEAIDTPDGVEFGFHRLRSHSVFPIATCPIHDERIERAVFAFRDAANELRVRGIQSLHLTAEPNGRGLLWALRFKDRNQRVPGAFAARVATDLPDLVLLDDSMSLDFWQLRFRVRTDTFIQTNYRQMLVLYECALAMLAIQPSQSVLDLYAGIGTISLPLAQRARSVTAVEANPSAVNLGVLASRINAVHNVRFQRALVEDALAGVRLGEYSAAVLDPPRAGCEPAATAQLIRLGLDRLLYISCEPSTHARDIAALVRGGYRVREVALVDMFPQTYHVESVALLER
jgi:23S rRNA (uracil1939-C5)-methyltransferase